MSLFRRRGGRPDDQRVAEALRASLRSHAGRAPRGGDLAERILAAVDEPAPEPLPRPRPKFAGWGLPLVAAASVAAVAAVAVGLAGLGGGSHPVATGHGPGGTTHVRFPGSGHASPSLPPTVAGSPLSPPASPSVAVTGGQNIPQLQDLRILDLTFAGTNDGWALGSADCVSGPGRCTALLRTHDGRHWTPTAGARFNVAGVDGCKDPCVDHLRFANDRVGYAFGPHALFMTSDGGVSWQRQPGGAIALETLNGNVVRVTASHTGCPSWCDVAVETAAIGSTVWTPATLPGPVGGFGVAFDRQGDDVYLLSLGHPAGGASDARSTLFRSTDNGRTWQQLPEPCPQYATEVDSTAVAAGAAGRVSVICLERQPHYGRMSVAVSSDAGATWHRAGPLPSSAADSLVGDPATVLVAAGLVADGGSQVVISHDGGATWQPAPQLHAVSFVGFESPTVGRVIADRGRAIWTTRDGGRTWHRAPLG